MAGYKTKQVQEISLREYNPYLTKESIERFVISSTNIEKEEYEDLTLDEEGE